MSELEFSTSETGVFLFCQPVFLLNKFTNIKPPHIIEKHISNI